jgi:predicted nucleotidyltransferase component of viral defense system
MSVQSQAQVIEVFHLIFLRSLASTRQGWFVLKGGANIRYFFGSPRYSNDIDLDFSGREGWQVGRAVDKILSGTALNMFARQANLEIADVSTPKQTDTTRRWKIGLLAQGHASLVRTKIEFSDRDSASDDISLEVVSGEVVKPYGLTAPMVRHYGVKASTEQKIAALALRSETKARDIFDLDLLFRRSQSTDIEVSSPYSGQAARRASEISFSSFTTEVAPFLDPEISALYGEREWEQLRGSVISQLGEMTTDEPLS